MAQSIDIAYRALHNPAAKGVVIDTYRDVSQFWKYDQAAFLAAPVYSRDCLPAKNIE